MDITVSHVRRQTNCNKKYSDCFTFSVAISELLTIKINYYAAFYGSELLKEKESTIKMTAGLSIRLLDCTSGFLERLLPNPGKHCTGGAGHN